MNFPITDWPADLRQAFYACTDAAARAKAAVLIAIVQAGRHILIDPARYGGDIPPRTVPKVEWIWAQWEVGWELENQARGLLGLPALPKRQRPRPGDNPR